MVALVNCSACVPRADMAGFDEASIVGQLESERIELTAEFAEPVTERLVIEGQRVAAGDTILRQDQQRAAARLRSATASLAQHQARLDELTRGPREEQIEAAQASLHGARRDLDFRRTELERVQSLLDRDLASPNQRDRARADLDTAEASVEVHRARLDELLSGTRVEELEQAGAAVDIAAAQLQQAEIDMQRHVALAPVDATVDSLLLETGERPAPGAVMAVLLGGEQPYARVYVPEALRVSVTPGKAVSVHVDGISAALDGEVRWVSSEAQFTPYFALTEHDRGRLSYAAKIDLDWHGERLPDGVPVQVALR